MMIKSKLFNAAQIAWLKENYNTVLIVELTKAFNEKFSPARTNKQIYQFCRAHWGNSVFNKQPNSGQFKRGHTPWLAGTRGTGVHKGAVRTKRSAQEYFESITAKEGELIERADGLMLIKTGTAWTPYHRFIYSQAHGVELAHSDIILFRDGDNRNFAIDNLLRIDRSTHTTLVSNRLNDFKGDLLDAALLLARLKKETRKRSHQC